MRKVLDYLLLRTPEQRLGPEGKGKQVSRAGPGKISGSRLALAFLGLLLGITASFYISGITSAGTSTNVHFTAAVPTEGTGEATHETPTPPGSNQAASGPIPQIRHVRWEGFPKIVLLSFVICMLTYQGLYQSLRLYENEPTFLVVSVAFQYGFFWQAVIHGGAQLVNTAL